jgi:hypothetical protein
VVVALGRDLDDGAVGQHHAEGQRLRGWGVAGRGGVRRVQLAWGAVAGLPAGVGTQAPGGEASIKASKSESELRLREGARAWLEREPYFMEEPCVSVATAPPMVWSTNQE